MTKIVLVHCKTKQNKQNHVKFKCFMPPPTIKWLGQIVLLCSVIPSSSVSVHYLGNGFTHSTQIWHNGYLIGKCAGQVRILVMVQWFFVRDMPPYFEKKGNFQFLFIISPTVVHVQLIFKIWIYHSNTLVKFKFHHVLLISELFLLKFEKKRNF
jgi:hypothetical protein